MKEIHLIKRNGTKEPKDIEKIHKVLTWACEGISGVSPSEIEAQAELKIFNNMKTSDVHTTLIDSAHELISEETPNYDLVAGRLLMFDLRKRAYGEFEVPSLYSLIERNIKSGWYHKDLLSMYTEAEWNKIDSFVKHDNDFGFKISGAREWFNKYLVQNRTTGEFVETPQISYILIASILAKKYVGEYGINVVKEFYEDLSQGDVFIPSPIAAAIRTPIPQGASCFLIEVDDSLPSIGASVQAVMTYAAAKAGMGIGLFNLRATKQPVRGGDAVTTGPIPFGQLFQSSVNSTSQGAMRKGSANFSHCSIHLDIESLLVLKNNRGTEESRIRHADHTLNLNGYILRRMNEGKPITLFSPEQVPDLFEAFYIDQAKFATLYEKYEQDKKLTKKVVSGQELRNLFVNERSGTSRYYAHFVDNSNNQGSFIPAAAPIRMSNLCVEITLPTIPLKTLMDEDALISLCNLMAINWGRARKPEDLRRSCRNAVMMLDSLLDYQPYLLPAARNSTDWYRPLGIGVNNLAYFLAKRGLKYNKDALATVDEYMEAQAFYLTEMSVELAEKYGPCEKYLNTKYSQGIVPVDVRKKAIDELTPYVERQDWNDLRSRMKVSGIRNATLMACMPSETSSRVHGATNGVEPLRKLIVTKSGTKQVAPEFLKLKNRYDLEYDMDMDGYIEVIAVIQKWTDQSISANSRYDASKFPNNTIPGSLIWRHITRGYKYGMKTWYYHNNKKVLVASTEEPCPEEVMIAQTLEEEVNEVECESCQL